MRRTPNAVLSAVTLAVAAFGLSGCGDDAPPPAAPPSVTTSVPLAPPPPPAAPLPPPNALTDVLYRLADPNVPGVQKVGLVEHGTPEDAAALDRFSQALRDSGFAPLHIEAHDLAWSQSKSRNVIATVVVAAANEQPSGDFSFPMEFNPLRDGWQLTRKTADQLLQFGA